MSSIRKETYKALQGVTFLPKWFEKIEDVADTDYPLFLKPDDGQGQKEFVWLVIEQSC